MTNERITEFQSGFNTAFINSAFNSNLAYKPQFVYNDNKNGQKVFSSIEDELLKLRIENAFLKELRRLRLEDEAKMRERRESSTASEDNSN